MDPFSAAPNGSGAFNDEAFSRVLEALDVTYQRGSTNAARHEAQAYLDYVMHVPEAPQYGYRLASDPSSPVEVRFFGLRLLENTIKYHWEELEESKANGMRKGVIELAAEASQQVPQYVRNKIGQLWCEIAKRSWGCEWMDMDAQLCELWARSCEHQSLVLYILETLAEEIFNKDDPVASIRGGDLGKACVNIFTPASTLEEQLPGRDTDFNVRCGEDGWVQRICNSVDECLNGHRVLDENICDIAVRALNTLRATMPWLISKAIYKTGSIYHIGNALAVAMNFLQALESRDNEDMNRLLSERAASQKKSIDGIRGELEEQLIRLETTAVEVLCTVYTRSGFQDQDIVEILCPMLASGTVNQLNGIYKWTAKELEKDIFDLPKHTLLKKLSELLSHLVGYIESKPHAIPPDCDLPGFLSFLLEVFRHPSLTVSIPVLHAWTRLLRVRSVRDSPVMLQLIPGLLEIARERLVRYEAFPEDSDDPTFVLLHEDIDTVPERHAFLGNYRRYCVDIVEIIVRKMPQDAMQHILIQATNVFQNLYNGLPPFTPQTFSKNAPSVLRVDSQITVIDAALKGYLRGLDHHYDPVLRTEEERAEAMRDAFEAWCQEILQLRFEDPEINRKIIQLMVTFATRALQTKPNFAVQVLSYILNIPIHDDASAPQYSEAAKGLDQACTGEMQRLAMTFSDDFLTIYKGLEQEINKNVAKRPNDERFKLGYTAFLFIINHRSTSRDRSFQDARLQQMMNQVKAGWGNPQMAESLSSFQSFCDMLGLGNIADFLAAKGFHQVTEWASQQLDAEGQARQAEILAQFQRFPLRLTKTLLNASTEKMVENTQTHAVSCQLWADVLPTILPSLLQFISHAQAFMNIQNWSHLPHEMQLVMKRVLTDRFWQAGISTESKDDFFARVSGSKSSYEGFASTVRGTVRQIREVCYYILYGLAKFRVHFYAIPDLPGALSRALYENAEALSAHHVSVLLNVSTQLIDGCPTELRPQFLPPMISSLFMALNSKIGNEWEVLNRQIEEAAAADNLGDEMKNESILRQLTHAAVLLMSLLLEDHRMGMRGVTASATSGWLSTDTSGPDAHDRSRSQPKEQRMLTFIIGTPEILEPMLMFCKTVIRVRDTRCVSLVCRLFLRSVLPRFKEPSPVRDYVCRDLLRAAITSLHEPAFVDAQKDLASLISTIINLDPDTTTAIILELPGLSNRPDKVDRCIGRLRQTTSERIQRGLVLDLLSSLRGVSIHEQGKIERAPVKKPAVQEQYMAVEHQPNIVRGGSPQLDGMAEMFG
ncbi:armadillo-type protein [Phyllosticta citriasiana]|uniref:armadillo-type protein n=1 Tax=Phyllosticta citriasiana TaxID=595635 RepID=UPI0030FDBBFA